MEKGSNVVVRIKDTRSILLASEINQATAMAVVVELLNLAHESDEDITLYINSPGGSVSDGFAIYDVMNLIKPDVSTIVMGSAASMGAFLLCSGAKGKRYALPNSEVMIHQPLGGASGQATEIQIAAKHILRVKDRMNLILSKNTNQPIEKISLDTERDNYMFSDEALEYGIIDKILTNEK